MKISSTGNIWDSVLSPQGKHFTLIPLFCPIHTIRNPVSHHLLPGVLEEEAAFRCLNSQDTLCVSFPFTCLITNLAPA